MSIGACVLLTFWWCFVTAFVSTFHLCSLPHSVSSFIFPLFSLLSSFFQSHYLVPFSCSCMPFSLFSPSLHLSFAACPPQQFKSGHSNTEACRSCPQNSYANANGSDVCTCLAGYDRTCSESSDAPCTGEWCTRMHLRYKGQHVIVCMLVELWFCSSMTLWVTQLIHVYIYLDYSLDRVCNLIG